MEERKLTEQPADEDQLFCEDCHAFRPVRVYLCDGLRVLVCEDCRCTTCMLAENLDLEESPYSVMTRPELEKWA